MPPGNRPFYCLTEGSISSNLQSTQVPAGFDYCAASATSGLILSPRDSGRGIYFPYTNGKKTELVINTPVYQGGVVPATFAERRRAFLGSIGTDVLPKVLFGPRFAGPPRHDGRLRYHAGSSKVMFRAASRRWRPLEDELSARWLDGEDVRGPRWWWDARRWERTGVVAHRDSAEPAFGHARVRLGHGPGAGPSSGRRADWRIAPSGDARRSDGLTESGADHGPHRTAARPEPSTRDLRSGALRRPGQFQGRERHLGPRGR